ncbi:MAG: FR47-like protein [Thermoproteota archaeon]|nr:FR47-like protein [Thermoproteota archaeon]
MQSENNTKTECLLKIMRISELTNWGVCPNDIALQIESLMKEHGEGFLNMMTATEILESRKRFYVALMIGEEVELTGSIALDMFTSEITSLCVNPKWRKHGIGKQLVQFALHVLSTRFEDSFVWIRENNTVAKTFFLNLGFIEDKHEEESIKMMIVGCE